jgi:isoquinoline 1-oxidoreductase alpha subunit
MIELKVNDQMQQVDVEADTPLLWVIREQLNLIGTKFGCGMAQCGACTVHLNGQPIRSCVTPISAVAGQAIITIEDIADDSANLTKVQQA